MLAVPMSAGEVLSAFRRDIAYLFLGATFVAVGAVAAAFSLLRRKRDPLLLSFALFAGLYGIRLWIQSEVLQLAVQDSSSYLRLRFFVNYLVPIPAIWFLRSTGLLSRAGRWAGNTLILVSTLLAAATLLFGPRPVYESIDSTVVILAMITLFAVPAAQATKTSDFAIMRRGLLVFAAFVIWDNTRAMLNISMLSL